MSTTTTTTSTSVASMEKPFHLNSQDTQSQFQFNAINHGVQSTFNAPAGSFSYPYSQNPMQQPPTTAMGLMMANVSTSLQSFNRVSALTQLNMDAVHSSLTSLLRLYEGYHLLRHEVSGAVSAVTGLNLFVYVGKYIWRLIEWSLGYGNQCNLQRAWNDALYSAKASSGRWVGPKPRASLGWTWTIVLTILTYCAIRRLFVYFHSRLEIQEKASLLPSNEIATDTPVTNDGIASNSNQTAPIFMPPSNVYPPTYGNYGLNSINGYGPYTGGYGALSGAGYNNGLGYSGGYGSAYGSGYGGTYGMSGYGSGYPSYGGYAGLG